jgi:hypothetical protein
LGLACLTLLSHAAAEQPVLCTIDDAQRIDAKSALVLGFVARRLYADRVGMILTVTDSGEPPPFRQLPTIEVDSLAADAAAELLHTLFTDKSPIKEKSSRSCARNGMIARNVRGTGH